MRSFRIRGGTASSAWEQMKAATDIERECFGKVQVGGEE